MSEHNTPFFKAQRYKHEPYFEMSKAHFHPFYEIYYLISGKRRFFVSDTVYELDPGNILLIRKGELHRTTYVSSETHERFAINFSGSLIEPLIADTSHEIISGLFENPYLMIHASRRDYVEDLLQKLVQESTHPDEFSHHMIQGHLAELLVFLIRYQKAFEIPEVTASFHNPELASTIQAAAKYIRKHYAGTITLEAMAAKAHMSPSYFSKKFREVTSFGFKEYLIRIRLAESCKYLLETSDSITDIALSCGFNDSNYFGDLFRKMKGVSPLQYRKNKELI